MIDNTTYMDVQMVSEYLHVAKSTVYKWVCENSIPFIKLGTRNLFVKTQIDQWVLNGGIMVEELPEFPDYLN